MFGDIVLETGDGSYLDEPVVNVFLSDDLKSGRVDASVSGNTATDRSSIEIAVIDSAGVVVASEVQDLEDGHFAARQPAGPQPVALVAPRLWKPALVPRRRDLARSGGKGRPTGNEDHRLSQRDHTETSPISW